ncbi:MAG: hypothetical protein GY842_22015, partial [bacterium]|nr:hypothetical protein [bacterium]
FIQSATAINLRQGNQPRSNGGYTAIPGTSAGRGELFEDVARQYETSTGHTAGWAEINRHYRRQVVDFWRADPVRTMNLVIAKVRFFLTARNYGDIYVPSAEVARGLASRLVLAPLPTAWLIGPALVGLVLLARHPVRHGPELMMFAIPFLLVAVFWYTPRYRLPAIPALVMAGAWALQRAAAWRTHWRTTISVCGALSLVAVMGAVNRVSEFDPVRSAELEAQLGAAAKDQGRHEDAAGHFSAALEIRPGFAQARYE